MGVLIANLQNQVTLASNVAYFLPWGVEEDTFKEAFKMIEWL